MGSDTVEIIDCGIDYLTCTSSSRRTAMPMATRASHLLMQEVRNGNKKKPWGMSGFHGYAAGHVQTGQRDGELLVRLGGPVAQQHWRWFYERATNVSRADAQVTVRIKDDVQMAIAKAYKQALRWSKRRKGNSTVALYRSNHGGSTLYLGRRISDRFGRVYDKGNESKLDHYAQCVRWELETKRAAASSLLNSISAGPSENMDICHHVSRWFDARGCSSGIPATSRALLSVSRSRSDDHRRLRWLETCVRPSLLDLMHRQSLESIIDSLGLSGYMRRGLIEVGPQKRRVNQS